MAVGAEGGWVRQGTPHDEDADWREEPSEYGTALSPVEWDDYSSEQSVPVAAPRAQTPPSAPTAASPHTAEQPEREPVPGQEPDSEEEYRSDETGGGTGDDPVGDADDDGLDPVHIDASEQPGATAATSETDEPTLWESASEEPDAATSRPRPLVADASAADDEASAVEDNEDGEEISGEAAEYFAVDPVPAEAAMAETSTGNDAPTGTDDTAPFESAGDGAVDDTAAFDYERQGAVDDTEHTTETRHEEGGVDGDDRRPDVNDEEMEATQAVPVAVVAPDSETTGAIPDDLYRADGAEPTAVVEDTYPDVDVEEERLQARLAAERQARDQRLGAVATSSENASREDAGQKRVTTDKFFPSLGLFILRLVTASILGVTSWQILGSGVDATANFLAGYPLIPEPRLVAWILGFTLGGLALFLVIGLLQRLVGFLLLAIAVASLVFIRWGNFPIVEADTAGFIGDTDLLLAAVGLLLLSMGGGRWGIDGAFRASRAAAKAEREG